MAWKKGGRDSRKGHNLPLPLHKTYLAYIPVPQNSPPNFLSPSIMQVFPFHIHHEDPSLFHITTRWMGRKESAAVGVIGHHCASNMVTEKRAWTLP